MTHWTLNRRDGIALATFTRPPRNLMSMAAMGELEQLVETVADDDSVQVLVLTGGIDGYFVAHADLDDLAAMGSGKPIDGDPGSLGPHVCPHRIHAAASRRGRRRAGVGRRLRALARVHPPRRQRTRPLRAARGCRRHHPGRRRDATPAPPRRRGPRRRNSILSARIIDAEEALRIGLVEAVLPTANFVERALEWVAPIAAKPPAAVRAAKRAIIDGLRAPLDEGLRIEGRLFIECQLRPEVVALQERVADIERNAPPEQRVDL